MLSENGFRLGPEQNTFTALGRCPRTGRLGISITTREMAVGGRCSYIRSNLGAVATQASTDPRLGPLALELLEVGYYAGRVVDELAATDPFIENRQIGIVDRWGHTATRTGAENRDWAGHIEGDGWIAMGNGLLTEAVAPAMAKAMQESESDDIELRLMMAIDAGTAAGGQHNGQRSAAVTVFENEGFSIINLRVDYHEEPMQELWRLFNHLHPLVPYYRERPDNPTLGNVVQWAADRGITI